MATKFTIGDTPVNTTYTNLVGTTSGAGTGAKFNVTKTNGVYTVENGTHGTGYVAGDTIVITGGRGIGASANVHTVNSSGSITSVQYIPYGSGIYPLGGMGYTLTTLPTLTVTSANTDAYGASLYVPGILGDGAVFTSSVDRAGSITTINIIDPGKDYISQPNISLKVQDIVVSNVSILDLPRKGDVLFQGPTINLASYAAKVNSISLLQPSANAEQTLYNLRVFEYSSQPDPNFPLIIDTKNINMNYLGFATNCIQML